MDLTKRKEWLSWRSKGIGSSDSAIIWGESPYKNRYDLYLEKISTDDPKENGNFATEKGQELEPLIRKRWKLVAAMDLSIESEWLPLNVDNGNKVMRCSLDGHEGLDNLIIAEFKFQGKDAHENIKKNICPRHYWIQVQHQLVVSGAKKAYLVSYNDELDTINYMEILPDIEFHNEHIRKCKSFWKEVLDKTPSDETLSFKKEIKTDNSDVNKDVAREYSEISAQIKILEEKQDTLKKFLIAANGTADKTDFEFVTVTKATRAGSIEWKSIPEIQALKKEYLDTFKKPDTEYFLVKVKSEKS